LRSAEGNAGEIDLSLEPEYKNTYLNYIKIMEVVESTDRLAPRVYFEDATARCVGCEEFEEVDIVFIDSEKEEDIEIGREYDLDPPPDMQVYMHEKLAKSLGLGKGDSVVL